MSITVVAEKPSVARDLARVLGATRKADGYLEGNGYRVTWAIGHLVTLAEPAEIRPEWTKWRRELLPMLPAAWPLVVLEKTRSQYEVLKKLLTGADVTEVVCATDAGREGELIFRYIQEAANCRKPTKRLWISSLTDDAIRAGFARLKDGRHYDALADAARGRSRADWLVGMNLSRAYGLSLDEKLSVGRVQTPTLAMIVERDLAIRRFVPEDYLEVVARFSPAPGVAYEGTFTKRPAKGTPAPAQPRRLPAEGTEAEELIARA
jgi:DNA topoisomerase-3